MATTLIRASSPCFLARYLSPSPRAELSKAGSVGLERLAGKSNHGAASALYSPSRSILTSARSSSFAGESLPSSEIAVALSDSVFVGRKPWSNGERRFWSTPVRMGRRAAKIATRKNAADAKRAKVLGRFGKLIIATVKRGGASGNPELDALLRQAKLAAVPKDLIERNIKKAADKSQADFVEVTYEAYGLGGVGIVCEVLTDNINRSATEVRTIITKGGAKMADPGSVKFNFERRGLVVVPAARVDEDTLLEVAMDAGALDIVPETIVLDEALKKEMKVWNVWAPVTEYGHVKHAVEDAGMTVDADLSGLQLVPLALVEVDDETAEMNQAIIDKLNDLDDVDAVYSNQKDE